MNVPDVLYLLPKISNKYTIHNSKIIQKLCTPRTRSTHRSILPDTIARAVPNKSGRLRIVPIFFPLFPPSPPFFSLFPFFFHYSIHVAIATPHATSRIKRNASIAVANFGKQALRAFHFAVIYGPPILQIRHLFGRCIP